MSRSIQQTTTKQPGTERDMLAAHLTRLIEEYRKQQGTDAAGAIRDVLTDLRHICDILDLSFELIDARAYDVHAEEKR